MPRSRQGCVLLLVIVMAASVLMQRIPAGTVTAAAAVNRPPIVRPGGPYSGTAGQPVSFDGSASSDPDGDPLTYSWVFSDGGRATGVKPTHTFATAGTFSAALIVRDGRGGVASATTAVTIAPAPANRTPVSRPGGPYSGTAGQPVSFDGSASSDPDGDSLTLAWRFGDGGTSTGPAPTYTYGAAGDYTVDLTVSDGRGGTNTASTTAHITPPPPTNRPPAFTSTPLLTGTATQAYAYQAAASDPDGDPLSFALSVAPAGMAVSNAGLVTWTPAVAQVGPNAVTITVSDGRGGSDAQSYSVQVAPPPPTLTSIDVSPSSVYFSAVGATRALTITGRLSDQTTTDLTSAASGTTYESSNPYVARVSADGVVTAFGNGDATITARNSTQAAIVGVVVESGVTLTSLDLVPSSATLHSIGAVLPLTLNGHFSDQTIRDLTAATGTRFGSSDERIARVDAQGRVTAVSAGQATIEATYDVFTATASITIAVSGGNGLLTGEVYDDSRSQPLAAATITLVSDGGGALDAPVQTVADERGRFQMPGRSGDAILRITKAGFTSVDRRATIPTSRSATLLDARLTPLDARVSPIVSVFGGEAHDGASTISLQVPPGALEADTSIVVTPITPQGLSGRLPLGWSPVAIANIGPTGLRFVQGATLRLPNAASVPASAEVPIATYDLVRHAWVGHAPGHVTADGRTIEISLDAAGQVAAVIPDGTPFAPPPLVTGEPLEGVTAQSLPADASASGDVVPRSAAPGDGARAVGRLSLAAALPSGTPIQVHVTEQFDLLDTTSVVPLPFTQDLLVHARPRPPNGDALGATFGITPSRRYTIQELLLGVIKLRAAAVTTASGAAIVGAAGGLVSGSDDDALEVPAAALAGDTAIDLRGIALDQITPAVPAGFDLLRALEIDLVGVRLAQSAVLSIARPADLADDAQVLVAQVFRDPIGVARLRIVATARVESTRVVSQTAAGTLTLEGVVSAGSYLFLRAQQPVGFVTGRIVGGDGTTPQTLALVTTEASPFADLSSSIGGYVVAAGVAPAVNVHVLDTVSRNAAAGSVALPGRDTVAVLNLGLAIVAPLVTSTNPAANATNVPLDASIAVDFSEAIDPASISDANAQLQIAGAPVAVLRTLSADGRRLTIRPQLSLQGKSVYTLALTSGIRDLTGNGLLPFPPLSFTTFDPTKPPQPPPGQIVAQLPDEDGFLAVVGTAGTSAPGSPVTVTNLRTQEAVTGYSLGDGSFRLRISGVVGDEIALTFRDASDREATFTLTRMESNGAVGIGDKGGTIDGAGGRVGTILPRALTVAGVFTLGDPADATLFPVLGGTFEYADRFALSAGDATFNHLTSLTLSEGQARFAPQTSLAFPFASSGELIVPADFLVNGSLQFTAVAQDATGTRRSVAASTLVVASTPDTTAVESAQVAQFPTIHLTAPRQALANQQVHVSAISPTARVDVDLPAPAVDPRPAFLLTRVIDVNGEMRLSLIDRLDLTGAGAGRHLRTAGHELPGMTATGDYAAVSSTEPLAYVTGRVSGPAAIVETDGLPFVFETGGPNGNFVIPVLAGQAFTIRFLAADTGALLGTSSGVAPGGGAIDVGSPLATGGVLSVDVEPTSTAVVDIGAPLVFHFSEAVDASSLSSGIVVTDPAGSRIFGTMSASGGGATVTFTPLRRWRYGTTYRWGVAQSVIGLSGARLAAANSGHFTTFAPLAIGTAAIGTTTALSSHGLLAVVATPTGVAVLDTTLPTESTVLARVTIAGGANAAALLADTPVTDRNGQSHPGPFALVAAGNADTAGRLLIFDLSTPASPVLIGSTQLTKAPGAAPPAGVPDLTGVPVDVIATADLRAVVAVTGAGVFSVSLSEAIPVDASNAARGLSARYPADSAGSATSVAIVGTRVVALDSTGIVVLDAGTFQRTGGTPITGTARRVAALASFAMDVNGDGTMTTAEVFDLAVVAGGDDGTLQFYRLPATGDPVLLSAVRFTAATKDVRVDAQERLAYVGLGPLGMAIVDLDGPASVQPLDIDHDGTDDRILMTVDTPASAEGLSLGLDRGIGFVADGPGGLAVLQLLPPRARFTELLRDPVKVVPFDELSIAGSLTAYLTDDALRVTVDAITPPLEQLSLVIEGGQSGVSPLVTFANGAAAAAIVSGSNTLELLVGHDAGTSPQSIRVAIRTVAGLVLASRTLSLAVPDPGAARLEAIRLGPEAPVLTDDAPTLQLGVSGFYDNGQIFNLTRSVGTDYASELTVVATVDNLGAVTGVAGGTTPITASNGSVTGSLQVRVDRAAVLMALESLTSLTFRSIGEEIPFPVNGQFSDGRQEADPSQLPGLVFATTDASVVSVGTDGRMRATGAGLARVTATSGALQAALDATVDPRTPTAISGISIVPATGPLSLDRSPLLAEAVITGTGALDSNVVNVTITQGAFTSTVSVPTDLRGAVQFGLDPAGVVAGPVTATVSIVDPSTNQIRTDAEIFTLTPATADDAANDDIASASTLGIDRPLTGTLNGTTDAQDFYRVATDVPGTLQVHLSIPNDSSLGTLVLVIRNAAGEEISRLTLSDARTGTLSVQVPAGGAFVSVESSTGGTYTLSTRFVQDDVAVSSVSPMSGPAGTLVTIDGAGFSTTLEENQVFFSDIKGEVVSATTTRLQVRVPANAVNGTVEVISGDRRTVIPGFSTGIATSRPEAFVLPGDPAAVRVDPASGGLLEITRLIVTASAMTRRQDVDAIAAGFGGQVVGYIPVINQYVLQFAQNSTLDGLNALRQQVAAAPGVRAVDFSRLHRLAAQFPIDVQNTRDIANRRLALDRIQLFQAIDLIRTTEPYTKRASLKSVKVAVIDTGFAPLVAAEFPGATVEYFERGSGGVLQSTTTRRDDAGPEHPEGHGTLTASIIIAANDDSTSASGVLNSLVAPTETQFTARVYGANHGGSVPTAFAAAALDHIKVTGDIDVVNMSFGDDNAAQYLGAIQALRGRALIVAAAGNFGVRTVDYPAAFATEPNVMSVGATEVQDPGVDHRWVQGGPAFFSRRVPDSFMCDPTHKAAGGWPAKGSNCGSPISIAAPGTRVWSVQAHGTNYGFCSGTSCAAPIVSGVAALLQTIRLGSAPLAPSDVKAILIRTATDISDQWGGPMRRVNAYNAVVELLQADVSETVLIADHDAPIGGTGKGALVTVKVDSVTGQPVQNHPTDAISLDIPGLGLVARQPRSVAVSPDGNVAVVYVESLMYGEGLVEIDMNGRTAFNFIPLSGAPFPGQSGQGFNSAELQPPMVFSRDGRLLYVGTNSSLLIVNTEDHLVVKSFDDMPAPFNAQAHLYSGALEAKQKAISTILGGAVTNTPATAISSLAISQDGKRLFVTVQAGNSGGSQPGYTMPLNIDLYNDADTAEDGLQSNLSQYLQTGPFFGPTPLTVRPNSDEPADVAISPDGRFLYVVNGGAAAYGPPDPNKTWTSYQQQVATSESATGVTVVTEKQKEFADAEFKAGIPIIDAPGIIEGYPALSGVPAAPRFGTSVNYGWAPSDVSGGLVLSPSPAFGTVFAKRPFSMSIRPDGKRALVAFYQTGNFGVLDLEAQKNFIPEVRNVADGAFAGVVGVTPAIPLGNDLLPSRDTFTPPEGGTASPDNKLMFPTQVRYSQGGSFAIGIHTGIRIPESGDALPHEGGGVSFINDQKITFDLQANASRLQEPHLDGFRAYYSMIPVCEMANEALRDCTVSTVTTLFDYQAFGMQWRFARPRGAAIVPLLSVMTPRFGDQVYSTTPFNLRWRTSATRLTFRVLDLGVIGSPAAPTQIRSDSISLEITDRNLPRKFSDFGGNATSPGHRYRLEFTLEATVGPLVTTSFDVAFIR